MNAALPTRHVLNVPELTLECFAATTAAAYDVDALVVHEVLTGARSTKVLPVAPAVAVCRFLAARDLDAARTTAAADQRSRVNAALTERCAEVERERVLTEARAAEWVFDEVVDAMAAKVTGAAERCDVSSGVVPRLDWVQHPSPVSVGSTVSPPPEMCLEVIAALFDGRTAAFDVSSECFDPVRAVLLATQIVPNTDIFTAHQEPSGALSDLCTPAAAVLVAAVLCKHNSQLGKVVGGPPELRSELLKIGAAAASTIAAQPTAFPSIVRLGLRIAGAAVLADPLAAHGSEVAACLGAQTLDTADEGGVEQLLALLLEFDDGGQHAGDAAAAEVAVAATADGARRIPVLLRRVPETIAAKGPMVCLALAPPTGATSQVTLAWVQAMGGTAAQFWDAEGFSRAVKQHPQVAKVLCGNVRGLIGTHTARPPQWLTHASMKEVGLSAWLDLDPACGAELVAAGAALSFEAWRAVWVLVPDFRGTPAELVAVAATAS